MATRRIPQGCHLDAREVEDRGFELSARVVEGARARGLTIATAESCTAGMVCSLIADVPGASSVLRGGAVTYCDEVKRDVLGVPPRVLAEHSAVSDPCARSMAEGARRMLGADIAVSLTGYAGPGGGTEADPVGTVYIGISDPAGTHCRRWRFPGDRGAVRRMAALAALESVLARLHDMDVV